MARSAGLRTGTRARGVRIFAWWAALWLAAAGAGCGAPPGAGDRAMGEPPGVQVAAAAGERAQPLVEGDAGPEAHAAPADADVLPADATLADCLAYAARHNAELRASFHRWRAALEQIPQAEAPPDPRLTYAYYIREVETRVGAQRQSVALSQTLPWLHKLALRGDAAAEAAEAESQRMEALKQRLFHRVKDAYYELYYLGRAVAVTQENLRLLELIERDTRTRYKVGAAAHPDLIRLQVELGKLTDRLATLGDLRAPIQARLNAAMNRPPAAELSWPREIPPAALSVPYERLLAWMWQGSPALKALDSQAAAEGRKVDLAKQDYLPDVTLGMTWIDTNKSTGGRHPSDDGQDPMIAMLSVNLPVWREKLDAAVREAKRRHRAARLSRAQEAHDLGAQLRLAVYRFRDAERKAGLYRRTLLPKARQSLKVTQAAFRAGRAAFADLIDAQRVLLEFELSAERARTDAARHLAEIEMLVGRPVAAPAPGPASRPSSADSPAAAPTKRGPDPT